MKTTPILNLCGMGLFWFATCAAAPAGAADDRAITGFSSAQAGQPPVPWKLATLPNKADTKFAIVDLDGARVLKVQADESYGNLVHAVHLQPTDASVLSWRWRVDQLVDGADLRTRAGDDAAAKLCVFFDFDTARLPFAERAKLALAGLATGQELPTETLCYVWDNKLPAETALVNAYTKRVRFIVLQSGTARVGQWVAQRRDLARDYQRVFGDESEGRLPQVVGVAVSADADNTHGHGLAYFGDVTLVP